MERISSTVPWIGARVVDDAEHPDDSILEVKLAAGIPEGKFQEKLILHTSIPGKPQVEIPVTGIVLQEQPVSQNPS